MGEQSSFGVDQPPVDRSDAESGMVDRTGVAGGSRALRVLVADDNAVIRMGLRQLLVAEPAVDLVAEACDGEQALQLAALHDPDDGIQGMIAVPGPAAKGNILIAARGRG